MHIKPSNGLKKLAAKKAEFLKLFEHGSLEVEIYKPDTIDRQKPHDRDEIYVIISGKGRFFNDGDWVDFEAGDFLFVKAGKEHRFEAFSDDFSTWVFFYGPIGGEAV
ncbi:MAG: cupin domain-containing protein [Bacteroidetes bacterium]|nr:cupin domain-containing protein [Bacteroidota bacterium]